jgi:hypothetical protein
MLPLLRMVQRRVTCKCQHAGMACLVAPPVESGLLFDPVPYVLCQHHGLQTSYSRGQLQHIACRICKVSTNIKRTAAEVPGLVCTAGTISPIMTLCLRWCVFVALQHRHINRHVTAVHLNSATYHTGCHNINVSYFYRLHLGHKASSQCNRTDLYGSWKPGKSKLHTFNAKLAAGCCPAAPVHVLPRQWGRATPQPGLCMVDGYGNLPGAEHSEKLEGTLLSQKPGSAGLGR